MTNIYSAWKHGMGDCIGCLSSAYYYGKNYGEVINISNSDKVGEEKTKKLFDFFKKQKKDFEKFVKYINYKDINRNTQKIIPGKNFDANIYEKFKVKSSATIFMNLMGFPKDKDISVNNNFTHRYLECDCKQQVSKKYITVQLRGFTTGKASENYIFDIMKFKGLLTELESDGYDILLLPPYTPEYDKLATIHSYYLDTSKYHIDKLFEIVGSADYHVGVSSGLAFISMCCNTKFIYIKPKDEKIIKYGDYFTTLDNWRIYE